MPSSAGSSSSVGPDDDNESIHDTYHPDSSFGIPRDDKLVAWLQTFDKDGRYDDDETRLKRCVELGFIHGYPDTSSMRLSIKGMWFAFSRLATMPEYQSHLVVTHYTRSDSKERCIVCGFLHTDAAFIMLGELHVLKNATTIDMMTIHPGHFITTPRVYGALPDRRFHDEAKQHRLRIIAACAKNLRSSHVHVDQLQLLANAEGFPFEHYSIFRSVDGNIKRQFRAAFADASYIERLVMFEGLVQGVMFSDLDKIDSRISISMGLRLRSCFPLALVSVRALFL